MVGGVLKYSLLHCSTYCTHTTRSICRLWATLYMCAQSEKLDISSGSNCFTTPHLYGYRAVSV